MATTSKTPFQIIADYERRSLIHAAGLPEQASAQGAWSGIAFRLGKDRMLASLEDVAEILHMPDVTQIPGAAGWILGIANVRGNLIAVVDMHAFLGEKRTQITDRSRVLVVNQEGGNVGLLVDEVVGQRHMFDEDETNDNQFAESLIAGYITRQYAKEDEHWGVFDVTSLTNSNEFLNAAA